MMRLLIFNADDYGISPGVSLGIREASAGVVRSTTVLANRVSRQDISLLGDGSISAGAHLALSAGMPMSEAMPEVALKPDGSFSKQFALEPSNWGNDLLDGVRREWKVQLASLMDSTLDLTHLDSHHHVHLQDALFPIALELARQNGLAIRTRPQQAPIARRAGVRTTDNLVEGFNGPGAISSTNLFELLAHVTGDSVEVMCHPGHVDDELTRISGYLTERETEHELLCSPDLATRLESLGWRLGGFDQIP